MERDAAPRRDRSGRTVVECWVHYYMDSGIIDRMRALAARFNRRQPHHRVEIIGHNWKQLPRAVHREVGRGRTPALVQYFYASAQVAADMRTADGEPLFTPVGKAVDGRTEILGEPVVLDDLVPAVRDYYSRDGTLLCAPTLASTTLLYANTTLLRRAGIAEMPQTWDEVEAACAAVRALADGPPHGIVWPNHGWFFQQALAQQNVPLVDGDNGRSGHARTVDLTSDGMMAYVDWWRRLHENGHYLYTGVPEDWRGSSEAFARQQAAFVLSSSVEAASLVRTGLREGFEVRAARLPGNADVPWAGAVLGGDSFWLADGLDEETRDGALAFVQYMTNVENAVETHRGTGYIPITQAAVRSLEEEGWFVRNPHLRVALDQFAASGHSPAARGALLGPLAAVQDAMVRAMHDVLVSKAAPRERFVLAETRAQRLLDAYNAWRSRPGGTPVPEESLLDVG